MAFVNKVFLLGNLTRDPEVRQLPSGTSVCDFAIATNRQYKTSAGEDREETLFCDCTAFGRIAEVLGEFATKGRQLFVEGRLHYESWEDSKTGTKRSKLSVIVESFQFLGPRQNENAGGVEANRAPAAKPWRRGNEAPAAASAPRAKNGSTKRGKNVDQAAEENEHFEKAELPF